MNNQNCNIYNNDDVDNLIIKNENRKASFTNNRKKAKIKIS